MNPVAPQGAGERPAEGLLPDEEDEMGELLVQVEGLEVRRGAFTLSVPTWRLEAGTVTGLVGANGAGKSTLLAAVAGFNAVDGGTVRVFGLDPFVRAVEVRTQLGFMSDEAPLFDLRVGPLIRTVSGYYPSWNKGLAQSLIDRFAVEPSRRVRELSRGEGTRLRLVLALAFEPRVVLLDEPSTGLDLDGHRALLQTILEVVRDEGRSVVVSSHRLEDVERIADQLLVLDRGRVVTAGSTETLIGPDRTLDEALLAWGGAS